MGWTELFETANRHDHVFTYADAARAGIARSTLDDHARAGMLQRPFRSVFLVPGADLTGRTLLRAALTSVGPPAVLAGASALHVHGVHPDPPCPVQLWVPASRKGRKDGLVHARRTGTLTQDDVVRVGGLPTVTVARAVMDRADVLPLASLRNLVIDLRHADRVSIEELEALCRRLRGSKGVPLLRHVADDLRSDGSDSGFEFGTRDRLIDLGFRPSPGQAEVRTRWRRQPLRIDIPFLPERVGIECVGWRYHRTRAQLDADAKRQNAIAELDAWLILQLTWAMQFGDAWEQFVDTLRGALWRRRQR